MIIVIFTMIAVIFFTLIFGKLFKFNKKFLILIGVGNSVCGSSAIAVTQQIIKAKEEEVGISITVVNLMGTLGIFLVPFVAKYLLNFHDFHTGFLAGNTLQAVGHVIAAGFSISDYAGQTALIIKMVRILMLLPIVAILIFKNKTDGKKDYLPNFILGFIVLSIISSFNFIPENILNLLSKVSHYLLIISMAAIGLKIELKKMLFYAKNALILGFTIFGLQIFLSIVALNVI